MCFTLSKIPRLRDSLDKCFWNHCAKLTSAFFVTVWNYICVLNCSLPGSYTVAIRCNMNLLSVALSPYTTSLTWTGALIPRSITILKYYNNMDNMYNVVVLFSCPPDREVWPNYEVVMFQTRPGTATSICSVAIVTSYLCLSHRSTVLCPPPSTSVSQLPLPSTNLWMSCTTLLSQFSTLILVLDRLAKQSSISASLHCLYCTLCLAALYLTPRSLLAPEVPHRKPISAASSPTQSFPFCWTQLF